MEVGTFISACLFLLSFTAFLMKMLEMEDSVRKYFKEGDIVTDFPGSIWGNKKFIVEGFHGNWYCPCATVLELGRPASNRYRCNFITRDMRLVGAARRPMKNLDKRVIAKMMKNGVIEAKREFLIRLNTKTL